MAEVRECRQDNPFGVLDFLNWNHEWNRFQYPDAATVKKTVRLMKKAGIGTVRLDFLWQDIEPRQGKFDYSKYDMLVDLLVQNNIQILGLLDYSADWASASGQWNCLPKDNGLFLAYVSGVVSRYKGKVKYWEFWNEPDSSIYLTPQDGLKSYVALLKQVYTQIKKIDPDCMVLNGGLANGLLSVNRLYDNGAQGHFDILNVHAFETPFDLIAIKRVTAFLERARKVMERNGDADKKIWVTEIGCPGVKPGIEVANWWMGGNPTEEAQAGWVTQVYTTLRKIPYVEKVFWAFFRDTDQHWKNGVDYFGLVRHDFSLKPAYKAYQKLRK